MLFESFRKNNYFAQSYTQYNRIHESGQRLLPRGSPDKKRAFLQRNECIFQSTQQAEALQNQAADLLNHQSINDHDHVRDNLKH